MSRFCYALALLLIGCTGKHPDAQPSAAGDGRYPGEDSLALIYGKSAEGKISYLCSGALVILNESRTKDQGILTASHCFTEPGSVFEGFYVSFDEGKSRLKLGKAKMGDRFTGMDIAYIELDPQAKEKLKALKPLAVSMESPGIVAGDVLWSWGNPDNQGQALSVGDVMNPHYKQPPSAVRWTARRSRWIIKATSWPISTSAPVPPAAWCSARRGLLA